MYDIKNTILRVMRALD